MSAEVEVSYRAVSSIRFEVFSHKKELLVVGILPNGDEFIVESDYLYDALDVAHKNIRKSSELI